MNINLIFVQISIEFSFFSFPCLFCGTVHGSQGLIHELPLSYRPGLFLITGYNNSKSPDWSSFSIVVWGCWVTLSNFGPWTAVVGNKAILEKSLWVNQVARVTKASRTGRPPSQGFFYRPEHTLLLRLHWTTSPSRWQPCPTSQQTWLTSGKPDAWQSHGFSLSSWLFLLTQAARISQLNDAWKINMEKPVEIILLSCPWTFFQLSQVKSIGIFCFACFCVRLHN